ncbi:STAS domain-containing protein [Spirochaetota bacterium]
MTIDKDNQNGIMIYRPKGIIDVYASQDLKEILLGDIEEQKLHKIIIDLDRVLSLDSSALGVMVLIHSSMRTKGMVRYCNLHDDMIRQVAVAKMDKFLFIDETKAKSIEKINEAGI